MKNKLRLTIQIITGIIFIISGALKVIDSQSFSSLITSYGFGWAGNTAPVISAIEIILGLCLILNIQPKTTIAFATAITIVFTLLFSYAFFFRGIEDCGCMGSVKVSPYISLGRNILIIIGGLWIWYNFEGIDVQTKNWKRWTVYVLGGISLCVSGYTLVKPMFKPLVENYGINEGDHVNTTVFECFKDKISKDTCIIFIFSPECDHCWNATENIKSIKRTPGFTNVIGITYFDSDTSRYMQEMKPNFEILKYPTLELHDYVMGVPVFLVLKDGKVIKRIKPEEIPSGPMLRRMFKVKSN